MSDAEKIRHDLMTGLMEMADNLSPFLDVAEGHRAEMERRGWSPTAAETAALEMYVGALRMAYALWTKK